jgi:trigger factor
MTTDELNAISVEKLPGSEVKVTGEVPYVYLDKYRKHAVEHVQHGIELPGFRPGHIPENILIQKVGEMALITDMAEHALEDAYRAIVKHHNIDVIGHPKVSITKLAKDNPLGFSITVPIMPEFSLPEYKTIASGINKKRESKEVTDEEVTKQIEDILRQKVAYERLQEKTRRNADKTQRDADKNELGGMPELPTPESEAAKAVDEAIEDPSKLPLPELTDDYVKTLGQPGQFTSVDDFKTKIREHLTIQKAQDVDARHRVKITDAIVDKTEIVLPQIMIDSEMNQMFAQMNEDLERANLKIDDYLAHIKKSKEDLIEEWTPAATKRAKLQLVLNKIAKETSITPDPSHVDDQVSHILEQYKDADESRVRIYVSSVLQNDAVMKMLEEA